MAKEMYVGVVSSYTPIEYIESSGTQYIDTGIPFDNDTKIEMEFKVLDTTNQFLLGARDSSSTNQLYMIYYASGDFRVTLLNGLNDLVPYSTISNKKAKITFDTTNILLNIDGTDYSFTSTVGSQTTTNLPIFLFTCNTNGVASLPATMQLYSYKCYKNNVLVQDMIPSLDENNVPCLYDKVESGLYYNQGTGSFTYRKIAYIESTGGQLLDTGTAFADGIRIVHKMSCEGSNVLNGNDSNLYGFRCKWGTNSSSVIYVGWGRNNFNANITGDIDDIYTFDLTQGAQLVKNASGNAIITASNSTLDYTGLGIKINNNGSGRIRTYRFQIYNGTTLIKDLIPTLDANDIPCLYDEINSTYYYNEGAGDFIYGEAEPVLIGSKAKKIVDAYVGVESKARRIVKGYVGVASSYTPVEYIESTGTQYIDTGIKPNTNTKIEATFSTNDYSTSQYIFGVWVSGTDTNRCQFKVGTTTFCGWASSYNNQISLDLTAGEHTVLLNGGDFEVDGTSIYQGSGSFTSGAKNIYLLATNGNGTADNFASIKLKETKMYDGNTLVRNFIPVLDNNNVPCLFDKVENKPYYNLGTGTFTSGSSTGEPVITIGIAKQFYDVAEHYIQGTGTQYINSGFTATPNTTTIIDFQIDNVVANKGICGNTSYSGASLNYSLYVNSGSSFAVAYGDGGSYWQSLGVSADTNRHTISFDGYGRKVLVDGNQALDLSGNTATKNSLTGIYLFRSHNSGLAMKLYSAKIYNSGILVRDFVPALDNNNVACLYDKVSETYYYNAGTGDFIYG